MQPLTPAKRKCYPHKTIAILLWGYDTFFFAELKAALELIGETLVYSKVHSCVERIISTQSLGWVNREFGINSTWKGVIFKDDGVY